MKNIIYTLIAILGFANFTMAQVPNYVPTNGLVCFYPFNGNANDASGNGKNGTIYGGVSLTTDRFGNPNNSYNFNGTTGAILADTFYVSNNFTASFWYLASSSINLSASNNQNSGSTILCKGASISPCNYADFAFGFKNGYYGTGEQNCTSNSWLETELGWGCNYTYVSNCNSNISLQYNWTNLTIVLSSGYLKRYSNGVLIDSITYTAHSGLLANSGYPLSIGGRYVANCSQGGSCIFNFWKGKLDDIGIWSRALTQLEVTKLYQGCSADSITTQPTNQVGNKGSNKTISFAHSGTGNSYQWQSNAAVLGWQNVPNVSSYTGATTNSLTVNNLTVSNHNQLFRVVTSRTGCKDTTSNTVSLTLANIATDSLRLLRLQADSSRLSNDSILYLARINKLMNDSAYYTSRIFKLSNDSVFYVSRTAKLTNDSVYYNGRITKLISDSNVFVSRINKLSNDSDYFVSRITKLTNDSVYYTGRITKLINDSNEFVVRINKLSYDSVINLGRITNLKTDSINNKTTISLLNADIVTKGNIITFLQLDTTNKGITIRQLQTDLANKHDTVYIASTITSDTLRIAIRTGILSASSLINSLKVYPNPASTLLYIDLEKPGYFIAKLSSITGQSIITPTSGTIDVSSLSNGVYILTIYDSNNKLISSNKVPIIK